MKTKGFYKMRVSSISGTIDPGVIGEIMRKNSHEKFKISGQNKVLLIDWIDIRNRQKLLFPVMDLMLTKDSSFTIELLPIGEPYENHIEYKINAWALRVRQ